MRIFDRKFMQYQLAFGVWYNLNSRYLFLAMIFVAVAFFTNNLFYLIAVPFLYIYGYIRLQYLLNAGDERLIKRMERQYQYYQKKNEKSQGKYAFQLEKILFAVELEKAGITDAIEDVREILKTRPKLEKAAKGILLSLYILGKREGALPEIPKDLTEHLEVAQEEENNPNALLDYIRMALRLEDYEMALKLLDKAEVKSQNYKKQRYPVLKSIYKTTQVAIPFYRSMAYGKKKERDQAWEQLEVALRNSKSKKLKTLMTEEAENWI